MRWQIGLALELDKPLIIHTRNAHDETLALLSEYPGLRGVMHCFTMGPLEMRAYADLGLYLSYSGVLTYPANAENREAARLTPADRILIETDSPFLPPQPERGKRNEPAFVRYVLDTLAEVLGESPESLAERTSANARALFGLPCV
ncbi:MAG: TatD family hydrolase [Planctomycetota bacterium]